MTTTILQRISLGSLLLYFVVAIIIATTTTHTSYSSCSSNAVVSAFTPTQGSSSLSSSCSSRLSLLQKNTNSIEKVNANNNDGIWKWKRKSPTSSSSSSLKMSSVGSSSTSSTSTSSSSTFGRWEEMNENYILRPPPIEEEQQSPRALIHFLGGALVGSSPHITYTYLLEKLANAGYLIVATPYDLSFNHLETCDEIIDKFERVAPTLAKQYGALPVIGVGHSCGSLLHVLITSLFPDTPRAANALISYNNKQVQDAIPFFEEIFAPLFVSLAGEEEYQYDNNDNENVQYDDDNEQQHNTKTSLEGLNLLLEIAKTTTNGQLPSDKLINKVTKFFIPNELQNIPFVPKTGTGVGIPENLRDIIQNNIIERQNTMITELGIKPYLIEIIEILEQIPKLIKEVAYDNARDFIPTPYQVNVAARKAYRARRTLIIKYNTDPIDESNELQNLLEEAEKITRMKRPMIDISIKKIILNGGHAVPLLAPPTSITNRIENILGNNGNNNDNDDTTIKERLLYKQTDDTVNELLSWLEES